jgi:single-stranded DNA-binding protein
MVNLHVCSGYVGKVLKVGDGAKPFSFTMCSSRNYKKDDEWQSREEWFLISYFGRGKEDFGKSIGKGDYVIIVGEPINYEYDGKRGVYTNASYITKVNRGTSDKTEKKKVVEDEDEDDLPF